MGQSGMLLGISKEELNLKTALVHVKCFSAIQGQVGAGIYPKTFEVPLFIEVVDNYQAGVALPGLDIPHRLISDPGAILGLRAWCKVILP